MTTSIFQTASQIVPTIGWGTFCAFIIWLWKKSITLSVEFTKSHERGQKAMDQIDKMAINCFPTMQTGIEDLNKKTDEGNSELKDISKGIAVLVDRGRI